MLSSCAQILLENDCVLSSNDNYNSWYGINLNCTVREIITFLWLYLLIGNYFFRYRDISLSLSVYVSCEFNWVCFSLIVTFWGSFISSLFWKKGFEWVSTSPRICLTMNFFNNDPPRDRFHLNLLCCYSSAAFIRSRAIESTLK